MTTLKPFSASIHPSERSWSFYLHRPCVKKESLCIRLIRVRTFGLVNSVSFNLRRLHPFRLCGLRQTGSDTVGRGRGRRDLAVLGLLSSFLLVQPDCALPDPLSRPGCALGLFCVITRRNHCVPVVAHDLEYKSLLARLTTSRAILPSSIFTLLTLTRSGVGSLAVFKIYFPFVLSQE